MVIFYNLVSIVVGLILIYYGVSTLIHKKKIVFSVLTLVHAALFLGFGIYGFFIPEEYAVIVVLAMLAFTITEIICILTLNKKTDEQKK